MQAYCVQSFVRLHAIESEIGLLQEFGIKRSSNSLSSDMHTQNASMLSLIICMVYINLCAISTNRNRGKVIPKILEKCDYSDTCCAISFNNKNKRKENLFSKTIFKPMYFFKHL